jgi:hypothetical protein
MVIRTLSKNITDNKVRTGFWQGRGWSRDRRGRSAGCVGIVYVLRGAATRQVWRHILCGLGRIVYCVRAGSSRGSWDTKICSARRGVSARINWNKHTRARL